MYHLPDHMIVITEDISSLYKVIEGGHFLWPPNDPTGFSYRVETIEEFMQTSVQDIQKEWNLRVFGSDGTTAFMFTSERQ